LIKKNRTQKARQTGRLFVLSAPSGTGKTTLGNKLLKSNQKLVRSVSVTTRKPRRGEKEGKDYYFISRKEFDRLKRTRGLLEWTTYTHALYGTPIAPLKAMLQEGKDILLLLDVHGARSVKRYFKQATTIFLLPPSFAVLKERLAGRRTEKRRERHKRLQIAQKEMAQAASFDYVIVNDDIRRAHHALQIITKGC